VPFEDCEGVTYRRDREFIDECVDVLAVDFGTCCACFHREHVLGRGDTDRDAGHGECFGRELWWGKVGHETFHSVVEPIRWQAGDVVSHAGCFFVDDCLGFEHGVDVGVMRCRL
jgi:hypothetical protein